MPSGFTGFFALKPRLHRLNDSHRCLSIITSKTLPDLIKPSVKCAHQQTARVLKIILPAGFEIHFRELVDLGGGANAGPSLVRAKIVIA
jgi:hypothetical protein